MGRMMANSKGPQAAGTGPVEPTASGTAGPRRHGWARWRPYTAAVTGVAVVFGISAVIGAHVRAGKTTEVKAPTGVSSASPLAIPVAPSVPVTLTVYEDLRSPASKVFAQSYADTFAALLATGQVRIDYRMVTSVDATAGGHGSAMAANAAACAQDQGSKQFVDYVKQLWKHQPSDVRDDRFASESYLEKLGRKVPKLDDSSFVPCVHSSDHEGWVAASQKDYLAAGLGDVPVVQINGRAVSPARDGLTPARLTALVRQAAAEEARAQAASAAPEASVSPAPDTSAAPSARPSAAASAAATGAAHRTPAPSAS